MFFLTKIFNYLHTVYSLRLPLTINFSFWYLSISLEFKDEFTGPHLEPLGYTSQFNALISYQRAITKSFLINNA